MTKKGIIWLSILVFIIVLIGVLFGTVFCLRSQSVTRMGDTPIEISNEEIIKTANLKNGQSIFMLDKDQATKNIETTYPYVKVVQIKTTGVTKIDIVIRARHNMYYTEFNENFYIFDEELKVLAINTAIDDAPAVEPTNLTHLENGVLNITSETKAGDFVGTDYEVQVAQQLYIAMVTTVTKPEGDGEDSTEVYFTRADFVDMIRDVEFEEYSTFNKIIITTKHGVKLDIENPTSNLQNKINICFSTIDYFLNSAEVGTQEKATKGTIKIY
ncbi:MAG: FtsQ-type POTRA domain-containing protein [Clostridia bacterium]|nr:FtsQ-type POTRA domain-containing protein [Clostridia bacterium]